MIFNITKDTNSFDTTSFGSRTSLFGRVVKLILLFVTGHGRADVKKLPGLNLSVLHLSVFQDKLNKRGMKSVRKKFFYFRKNIGPIPLEIIF